MSAEITLQVSGEGQKMKYQGNDQNNCPLEEPDESWWASVLAEEPAMDEPEHLDISELNIEANLPEEKNPSRPKINWEKADKVFKFDEIMSLKVIGHNRGGLLVTGEELHGFVPASHLIDLPSDLSKKNREQYLINYMDQMISLKIIECEQDKERIVFSERAAQTESGQRRHLLETLCEGDIVNGVVTNVTNFGVFLDLGGLEGLIHVSELSWGRVEHPSEILSVDDTIDAMVLEISKSQAKIALSLKRMEENPWEKLAKKLSPGDVIDAEVSSIVKFGVFAKLEEGIEGLIHISSINFPNGCSYIDDFLYEGQDIKVCIVNFEPQKRRLGLKIESF